MIIKPTTPKIFTPQDKYALDLDGRDVRGSKIYDRSGEGNHGAITGAVIKPMNYGLPVLSFDGTDDYIDCGNDVSLNIGTSDFTISGWFKTDGTGSALQNIIAKSKSADGIGRYFVLFEHPNLMAVIETSGGVKITSVAEANYIDNNWHYFAAVFDRSANLTLYLDNIEVDTVDISDGVTDDYNTTFPLVIGAYQNVAGDAITQHFFNGQIANIQILKRVLIVSEISQRFNDKRHLFGI